MQPPVIVDRSVVHLKPVIQDSSMVSPTEKNNQTVNNDIIVPLVSSKKKQKKIIIAVISAVVIVIIALVLFLLFGVNRECQETLVVTSDSYCNSILQSKWRTITVNEGLCNDMTSDMVISGYACLEEIVVKKDSLKNLKTLIISDNPKLQRIITGDGEYDSSVDKVFKAPFLSVKRVSLESEMSL